MAIIVQKFGGTSLASPDNIKNTAAIVKAEVNNGYKVVVIVSAMSSTTDMLISLTREITKTEQFTSEYDIVVSSGEQISAGLLTMALKMIGLKATAILSWQLPIITTDKHGKARILKINNERIFEEFESSDVIVIPGFQGITENGALTTLGRGGSDTSAVAIAASVKAFRCDIYTDVDGVYTTDPRIVAKACKLDKISYREMLEMASLGAKVLQTRSVEIAMKHHVRLRVLSSFNNNSGTIVTDEDMDMERKLITGITCSLNEARITLIGIRNNPSYLASIFTPIAAKNINVDMIVQNISRSEQVDLTFTVPSNELDSAIEIINNIQPTINFASMDIESNIAKISVIGVGMRSHSGVAELMFKVLADKAINIKLISTSEIKISILIPAEHMELCVRTLHTAFNLDNKEEI